MDTVQQQISGWANFPRIAAEVSTAANETEVRDYIRQTPAFIVYGNGRSYGDAALAPRALSLRPMNKLLAFDRENGVVTCEAGMLLSDLLEVIVPKGWFFRVTPGIKSITVGGAVASDVHGKNHPSEACFSSTLLYVELMQADGSVVRCSSEEHSDLFWQTCGGMGWTGVILRAAFRLMRIDSQLMRQKTLRGDSLEALFDIFEQHRDWPYAAGWVDCTHTSWRGTVFFARHEPGKSGTGAYQARRGVNIPFFAPAGLLNPLSIRLHNWWYRLRKPEGEQLTSLDDYFYPLDAVQNWNRLYGKRGFIQYQFCLPEAHARAGFAAALQLIRQSGQTPFLSVMKRHGARPEQALNSFPISGYSLALDFPRRKGMPKLIQALDECIWAHGGRIYLTKDACSAPKMGRIAPQTLNEPKFCSLLKERIVTLRHED